MGDAYEASVNLYRAIASSALTASFCFAQHASASITGEDLINIKAVTNADDSRDTVSKRRELLIVACKEDEMWMDEQLYTQQNRVQTWLPWAVIAGAAAGGAAAVTAGSVVLLQAQGYDAVALNSGIGGSILTAVLAAGSAGMATYAYLNTEDAGTSGPRIEAYVKLQQAHRQLVGTEATDPAALASALKDAATYCVYIPRGPYTPQDYKDARDVAIQTSQAAAKLTTELVGVALGKADEALAEAEVTEDAAEKALADAAPTPTKPLTPALAILKDETLPKLRASSAVVARLKNAVGKADNESKSTANQILLDNVEVLEKDTKDAQALLK